jgi:Icc-related predicted phosphoesterase
VVEIDGVTFGFVGGGVETPLGAQGEVSDDEMRSKLSGLGEVDVLCSHLPPAVEPLYRDVVTGRLERGSQPILEYLNDVQPAFHFFGDVHQPQASTWRVGHTLCRNVGYFRATRRPVRFDLREVRKR